VGGGGKTEELLVSAKAPQHLPCLQIHCWVGSRRQFSVSRAELEARIPRRVFLSAFVSSFLFYVSVKNKTVNLYVIFERCSNWTGCITLGLDYD
jgi:hypothetical protein